MIISGLMASILAVLELRWSTVLAMMDRLESWPGLTRIRRSPSQWSPTEAILTQRTDSSTATRAASPTR